MEHRQAVQREAGDRLARVSGRVHPPPQRRRARPGHGSHYRKHFMCHVRAKWVGTNLENGKPCPSVHLEVPRHGNVTRRRAPRCPEIRYPYGDPIRQEGSCPSNYPPGGRAESSDSTADLVFKARSGDRSAENEIVRRNLPELTQYARGRLPGAARSGSDTEDLVQDTMIQALKRLPTFDPSRRGGFQAYLRTSLRHRVCDEVRRSIRTPQTAPMQDTPDRGPTPHDVIAARETVASYRRALATLRPNYRALVQAHIERDWTARADRADVRQAVGQRRPRRARPGDRPPAGGDGPRTEAPPAPAPAPPNSRRALTAGRVYRRALSSAPAPPQPAQGRRLGRTRPCG